VKEICFRFWPIPLKKDFGRVSKQDWLKTRT